VLEGVDEEARFSMLDTIREYAGERLMVVDLRSTAQAFNLPDRVAQAITDATPAGWRVHIVSALTDSFGDGAQAPSAEALSVIPDAEVYVGFGMPRALFLAGPQLRWVQTGTAGVATLLFDEMRDGDCLLTNAAGLYGPAIAEHVLAGVLHFLRAFDLAEELRREKVWDQSAFATPRALVREVDELHVLVVGAGGLGSEIARRFSALGARVTGIRRRPGLGVPPGFGAIHGLSELDGLLPLADVVVLATPLTEETRGLVDREFLAALPDDALVVNVARGPLIVDEDLEAAIESGKVGFARIAWDLLRDGGEARLAQDSITVRCLQTADGGLPASEDDPDLIA